MREHRLARLLSKVFLSRKQRLTVPYFRKYVVSEDIDLDKPDVQIVEPRYDVLDLADLFGIEELDKWDRRIYFEVVGDQLDPADDYKDETSDDEFFDAMTAMFDPVPGGSEPAASSSVAEEDAMSYLINP